MEIIYYASVYKNGSQIWTDANCNKSSRTAAGAATVLQFQQKQMEQQIILRYSLWSAQFWFI
jgi:hypothetical protein